jgi:hypothetical protein
MIPLFLYLLAVLDAAFVGYRDATGRSGLVRKRRHFARAMLRGVLVGQLPIAVIGLTVVAGFWMASDFDALWAAYEAYGRVLLAVFVPYAAVVLLAFLPRTLPSVDLRSMTNVVVFGPFTAIRPALVPAATAAAAWIARRAETVVLSVVITVCVLSLEPLLERFWRRGLCRPD